MVLTNHGLVILLVVHFLSQNFVAWPQFIELVEEELVAMMPAGEEEEELVVEEEVAYDADTQEPMSIAGPM